jgi:hypothetical protein
LDVPAGRLDTSEQQRAGGLARRNREMTRSGTVGARSEAPSKMPTQSRVPSGRWKWLTTCRTAFSANCDSSPLVGRLSNKDIFVTAHRTKWNAFFFRDTIFQLARMRPYHDTARFSPIGRFLFPPFLVSTSHSRTLALLSVAAHAAGCQVSQNPHPAAAGGLSTSL